MVHRHRAHRPRRGSVRRLAHQRQQRPLRTGARTAWHTHPNGQTIYVTEGVGRVQRRGGAVEVVQPGDRVFFEPGEDHWHGASPTRYMTHLSLVEVDQEGTSATWGAHVTDEEYGAAPPIGAGDQR